MFFNVTLEDRSVLPWGCIRVFSGRFAATLESRSGKIRWVMEIGEIVGQIAIDNLRGKGKF